MPCLEASNTSLSGESGPEWQRTQASGSRACALEKACRPWQDEQLPLEPSGLMRPMPELGQVAGSSVPSPRTLTCEPWH
jgi:hypothetical protein